MAKQTQIEAAIIRRQLTPGEEWRPGAGQVVSRRWIVWPAPPLVTDLEQVYGQVVAAGRNSDGSGHLIFHQRSLGIATILEFDAFAVEIGPLDRNDDANMPEKKTG